MDALVKESIIQYDGEEYVLSTVILGGESSYIVWETTLCRRGRWISPLIQCQSLSETEAIGHHDRLEKSASDVQWLRNIIEWVGKR
jgi:hypothetical protein